MSEQIELIVILRIKKIVSIIEEHYDLNKRDPDLITSLKLNQINNLIQGIINQNNLRKYAANPNIQLLINVNASLDSILELVTINAIDTSLTNDIYNKYIKNIEQTSSKFYREVNNRINESEKKLSELNETIAQYHSKQKQLDSSYKDLANQQSSKITELQNNFNEKQQQNDKVFSDRIAGYEKRYQDFFDDTRGEVSEQIESVMKTTDEKVGDVYTKLDSNINDSNKLHEKIKTLYGLAANDSTTGSYKVNASEEKKAANIWRIWAIVFMILASIGLLVSFFITPEGETDNVRLIIFLIKSFSFTGIMLAAASYSAKQSNLHRNNSDKARWLEIEMSVVDPFLESLDEERKMKIKEELSQKIFGNHNDNNSSAENRLINEKDFNVLTKLVSDLSKAFKS